MVVVVVVVVVEVAAEIVVILAVAAVVVIVRWMEQVLQHVNILMRVRLQAATPLPLLNIDDGSVWGGARFMSLKPFCKAPFS